MTNLGISASEIPRCQHSEQDDDRAGRIRQLGQVAQSPVISHIHISPCWARPVASDRINSTRNPRHEERLQRTLTNPVKSNQIPASLLLFTSTTPSPFPSTGHTHRVQLLRHSRHISARGLTTSLRDAARVRTFRQIEVGVPFHGCWLWTRSCCPGWSFDNFASPGP